MEAPEQPNAAAIAKENKRADGREPDTRSEHSRLSRRGCVGGRHRQVLGRRDVIPGMAAVFAVLSQDGACCVRAIRYPMLLSRLFVEAVMRINNRLLMVVAK
jgi:hypothetical protein